MAPGRIKIKVGALCSVGFIVISFLSFRTNLPKPQVIFFYNLIIIASLQYSGFYRGVFFLSASVFLTLILSLSGSFSYLWSIPVFLINFFIAENQIKKRDYYRHIVETRIDEVKENMNVLEEEYARHKKETLSIDKKEARYKALGDFAVALAVTLDADEVKERIFDSALKIIGKTEAILLFLVDTKNQELNLSASKMEMDFEKNKCKKGDLLDEWVLRERQCLLVEDIRKDFRFSEDKRGECRRGIRSIISAPLIEEKRVIGILRLEHSRPYNYTSEDLRLLDILCGLSAGSIQNAGLYQRTLDLALRDTLTGLYLRRYFLDKLQEELTRCLHDNLECSCLMIDIDNFKTYNDTYGHTAGDIVLKRFSDILKKVARESVVARYGGEEFAVLLPDTSKEAAINIAEIIRNAVKGEVIELRREKTQVTISIGIAAFPEDAKFQDELILKADERLYMAKRNGKDRVVY